MRGIEIRAGVHTGEVEIAAGDLHGLSVHLAARVMAAAPPGRVHVSATTHELVAGSGPTFEDAGMHELKGISGARQLHVPCADLPIVALVNRDRARHAGFPVARD